MSTPSEHVFQPHPGQVDFTHARYAPVINIVVRWNGKILIVQRSANINFYPSCWNGISGFLDDGKTLEEKVREELREELGLSDDQILSIKQVGLLEQEAPAYNKVWIVHPVLAEIATDQIQLDWEAQNYKWLDIREAKTYNLMPGFHEVLRIIEKCF